MKSIKEFSLISRMLDVFSNFSEGPKRQQWGRWGEVPQRDPPGPEGTVQAACLETESCLCFPAYPHYFYR